MHIFLDLLKVILTDQGRNFISGEFEKRLEESGIEHRKSSTQHGPGNGAVEKVNRTFKQILTSLADKNPAKCNEYLPIATYAYNISPHSATGMTPFELMFGRKANDPIDRILARYSKSDSEKVDFYEKMMKIRELSIETLKSNTQKMLDRENKGKKDKKFEIGDLVLKKRMIKSNLKPPPFANMFVGPYEIIEILDKGNYAIKWQGGTEIKHINGLYLKRWYPELETINF